MLTSLNIILVVLKVIEVLSVTALILLAFDLAYFKSQERQLETESVIPEPVKARHNETEVQQLITEVKYWIIEIRVVKIYEDNKKALIRRAKEVEAARTGGFFEESWVNGFNTTGDLIYRGEHRYPTEETPVLIKAMDERADTQIFENTEEV